MQQNAKETADLVTFTEEILYFLCNTYAMTKAMLITKTSFKSLYLSSDTLASCEEFVIRLYNNNCLRSTTS